MVDEVERDLIALWHSQTEDRPINHKETTLRVAAQSKKLSRRLFWRDTREVLAGAFTVLVYWVVALQAPGWWPKLGAACAGVLTAQVLCRLLSERRRHPRLEAATMVETVRAELARVRGQMTLLGTVDEWYVRPLALGTLLWALSLVPAADLPMMGGLGAAFAVLVAILTFHWVGGAAVVRLNQVAVDRQLRPYHDELAGLLSELETDELEATV